MSLFLVFGGGYNFILARFIAPNGRATRPKFTQRSGVNFGLALLAVCATRLSSYSSLQVASFLLLNLIIRFLKLNKWTPCEMASTRRPIKIINNKDSLKKLKDQPTKPYANTKSIHAITINILN